MTGFLATIPPRKRLLLQELTPAPGRRTQSISPYAKAALVSRNPASTASHRTLVTIAIAPQLGETGEVKLLICPTAQRKYFYVKVWTDFL